MPYSSRYAVRLGAGLVVLTALAVAGVLQRRRRTCSKRVEAPAEAKALSDAQVIGELIWPRWGQCGIAGRGQVQMLVMLCLAAVRTYISHVMTRYNRDIEFAKQAMNTPTFVSLMRRFLALSFLQVFVWQISGHMGGQLELIFREKLTKLVHKEYFKDLNFYTVAHRRDELPDPDERIAEDIKKTAETYAMTYRNGIYAASTGLWGTIELVHFSGWKVGMAPYIYLIGGVIAIEKLVPMDWETLIGTKDRLFSRFRSCLLRTNLHCEAIAALNGAKVEEQTARVAFSEMMGATHTYWRRMVKHGLVQNIVFEHAIFPFCAWFILLPMYLRPKRTVFDLNSNAAVMGELYFSIQIFIQALNGAGSIAELVEKWGQMGSNAKRIADLRRLLQTLSAERKQQHAAEMVSGDYIAFENVDIVTPTGNELVKGLTFVLQKGEALLITGHNGAGKSSIFRCLGGLWNIPTGKIIKPGASDDGGLNASVFYLPQRPYNVLGTIVDQLTYPEQGTQREVSEADLRSILEQVDLAYLLERNGVLEDETNWEEAISLGEKQRLAIARLLFQVRFNDVHFAILDECTSACSVEMEQRLFGMCNEHGISYITISHRPALIAYHDKMLTIGDGKAGFTLQTLTRNVLATSAPPSKPDESSEESIKKHQEKRSKRYEHLRFSNKQEGTHKSTFARTRRLLKLSTSKSWRSHLACIGVGVLLKTGMNVAVLHYIGKMIEYLIPQDIPMFNKMTLLCVAVSLCQSGAVELMNWGQRQLMMGMRDALTSSLLSRFYHHRNFYTLLGTQRRVSDPEQRMADDVESFTEVFSETLTKVLSPGIDVIIFSSVLARYTGLTGVVGLWGYLLGSLGIYKVILPEYDFFIKEELSLQGKFKFVHGRVRSHAESVAFFGGGDREREIVDARFDKLMELLRRKRVKDTQFGFAEGMLREKLPEALEWGIQFFFLTRNGSDGGGKAQYDMWNVGQAVTTSIHSFTEMMKFAEKISTLSGIIARVAEVDEALQELDDADSPLLDDAKTPTNEDQPPSTPAVQLNSCDIVTPIGVCLAQNLCLDVTPDQPLMVTGPNACGKSSLFRVLGGLWPLQSGQVRIRGVASRSDGIFLVPQRIYCCQGSLADQVTYPVTYSAADRDSATTQRVLDLLNLVGVKYLAEREEGLDQTKVWEDVLSLGEQQRIGIARMYYARPQFGVLDECTSACSVDVEEKLYTEAVGMGIACITLSQRLALEDFHTQELRMGANNERGYEICKIPRDHGSFDPRTAGAGLQCTPDLKLTSPLQVGGTL